MTATGTGWRRIVGTFFFGFVAAANGENGRRARGARCCRLMMITWIIKNNKIQIAPFCFLWALPPTHREKFPLCFLFLFFFFYLKKKRKNEWGNAVICCKSRRRWPAFITFFFFVCWSRGRCLASTCIICTGRLCGPARNGRHERQFAPAAH